MDVYRLGETQTVACSTSATSIANGVGVGTHHVRVVSSVRCHVAFGASPTATTSDAYVPAGVAEYFVVTPGQKLSAIRAGSTSGNFYVTECSG